jgi:hypothetical protein
MSSAVGGSRRSFYYTMNYDDEADLDNAAIVSPNRNQTSCECKSSSFVLLFVVHKLIYDDFEIFGPVILPKKS